MTRKFIRYNTKGRVVEILPVEGDSIEDCEAKLTTMFSPEHVAMFAESVALSTPVKYGQIKSGSTFVDYIRPPLTQEQINRQAESKIERLHLLALREVVKIIKAQGLETPELDSIISQVQAEKAKII